MRVARLDLTWAWLEWLNAWAINVRSCLLAWLEICEHVMGANCKYDLCGVDC